MSTGPAFQSPGIIRQDSREPIRDSQTGQTPLAETRFKPGRNVRRAGDDSLFAVAAGVVRFHENRRVDVEVPSAG